MNQAFDIFEHILSLRNHVTVIIGHIKAGGHIVGGLFNYIQALSHFFDAYQITSITIPAGCGGNFEFKIFVARIGHFFAQIPFQPAASQIGPGHPPVHCILQRNAADTLGAGLEDGVFTDQILVFLQALREYFDKFINGRFPPLGQVRGHPADPEPGWVQSASGDVLDNIEDHLPLAKGIEIRRHGPDVVGIGREPDQMVAEAKELAQHHPDRLSALRDVYISQGFKRQKIGEIIGRAGQVVDPCQIGNKLVPGLAFGDFFNGPVVIADFQVQAGDFLPV